MNKQFERYLQITLILLDLVVLNVILILCKIILTEKMTTFYSSTYYEYWIISNGFGYYFLSFQGHTLKNNIKF